MDKKTFIPYEKFKEANSRRKTVIESNKTDEEIIAEVLEIRKQFTTEEGE